MSKQNKKIKKANNIGTGMHTVSYLTQPYINSDYDKQLTLQEIVEQQEKHKLLIPRSKEDQEYIEKLESLVVKDIPENIFLNKCQEYFLSYHVDKLTDEELTCAFDRKYASEVNMEKSIKEVGIKKSFDRMLDKNYVEPEVKPLTNEQKLNLLCHCHNCDGYFPLRNLKWIDTAEKPEPVLHSDVETLEDLHWNLVDGDHSENSQIDHKIVEIIKTAVSNPNSDVFYPYDDLEYKYYGLVPVCAKYPICPSPWSNFDLWLKKEQYSLEDHKKGKYHQFTRVSAPQKT